MKFVQLLGKKKDIFGDLIQEPLVFNYARFSFKKIVNRQGLDWSFGYLCLL